VTVADDTNRAAVRARRTWRTLEPLHGMIYFVPEAAEAYAALGIAGRDGYFASRSAPMGAVSAGAVVSTFFNFNPTLVHHAIPAVWEVATPTQVVEARFGAVDGAFRRLLGDEVVGSDEMRRAAALARRAAEVAATMTEGRPLCAGHTTLPWPVDAHLALWHAQSILREFRGDGHIALLVGAGLSGLDSLVTHAASGEVPRAALQVTRAWDDSAWEAAVDSLRGRGWLTDAPEATFTNWGATRRHQIEEGTDRLAAAPYAALGDDACGELRALVRPWSKAFADVLMR